MLKLLKKTQTSKFQKNCDESNVPAQSYSHSASFSMFTACFLVFFTLTSLSTSPLFAQSLADKFGGFSRDSNQPIDIEADQLKVNDIKKTALFSGNVKARQGDFVLRSKFLEVFYDGNARPGAKSGANGKVKKLEAKGKVLITTKDKQSATSEWARFDVAKQTIILGDTVVLTQGESILKGGRLIVNLKTRQSRFENANQNKGTTTKKGQRVIMKLDVNPKAVKKLKKPQN
ncbi:MAG: LptA/OstA family protein [Hyphomicrobiales bacterium]